MKAQSFQVRTLKHQIQACLKLIAAKVKSAVLRLLDLEEKLEVAMKQQMPNTKRLLPRKYIKPQAQFSETVCNKAKKIVSEWLQEFGLVPYHANLLATDLLDKSISEKIAAIPDSAPDVYLSDGDKCDSLVMSMRQMALKLDEEEKLEGLLDELVTQDSQRDGNGI